MKIDLFHNKIVKDTATEQFVSSVNEVLVPMISALYPDARGILMYEDYVADGFMRDGMWYYPLTVRRDAGSETVWISWRVDKKSFATASPYSYVGEGDLVFELCDFVPEDIAEAMRGRAIDYDESAIKINVRATAADVMLLCGHYSQTFVDQMASQITKRLSSALSIDGLGTSTIELELVFAPGTYMEHTSENVTYRRLLMVDGASRPRDFWVKWTRVGGGVAYSVSDSVGPDDIIFELGEDVAHKIREKEYRFLCSTNPTTYQSAMGKRAVTEWRDLVKRAVRRGEIVRLESELEVAERAAEVHDKLTEVLSALGQKAPVVEQSTTSTAPTDGGFDSLMDLVRAALEKSEGHSAEDALLDMPMIELDLDGGVDSSDMDVADEDNDSITEDESDGDISVTDDASEEAIADEARDSDDEIDDQISDAGFDGELDESDDTEDEADDDSSDVEGDTDEDSEDSAEEIEDSVEKNDIPDAPLTIDELLRRLEEAANAPIDEPDEDDSDEDAEVDADEPITVDEESEDPADEADDAVSADLIDVTEDDGADENTVDESDASDEVEEIVKADDVEVKVVDEDSIRREIEARIRLEYEEQARARAEAEIARLIAESNALREENERLAKAARAAEAMHRQAVSDHLDATERAKATEDMLRAELEAKERREARERDRLAEAARIAVEEQRRREAEMEERYRIEREEAERLERERIVEEERIRAEEAERARREAEAAAIAAEPKYISKRAKIIFRRAADANVIGKIREIIEETIRANNKQHVRIHMKAYQEDRDVVNLDILKMPADEQELLIAIVKAIGNARIGVIKIILE